MIRVTDYTGEVHEYDDGDEGHFETEDAINNLVVDVPAKYTVFAEGKWVCVEQDKPEANDGQ